MSSKVIARRSYTNYWYIKLVLSYSPEDNSHRVSSRNCNGHYDGWWLYEANFGQNDQWCQQRLVSGVWATADVNVDSSISIFSQISLFRKLRFITFASFSHRTPTNLNAHNIAKFNMAAKIIPMTLLSSTLHSSILQCCNFLNFIPNTSQHCPYYIDMSIASYRRLARRPQNMFVTRK